MQTMNALVAASMILATEIAGAGSSEHWGYSGANGPEHWAELGPGFATCSAGKNQSPIDLSGFIEADLHAIDIRYGKSGDAVLNNGHTIQVHYAPGSRISLDGHTYDLQQFHFHAPSENRINGKAYPMEAHLVHADGEGHLAVIAVMLAEGAENRTVADAWAVMPAGAGETQRMPAPIAAEGLLPAQRNYYRYSGSLTTPPCTEGVVWLVMKEPVTVSKAQLQAFAQVMHHANNRPLQAANVRPVLR